MASSASHRWSADSFFSWHNHTLFLCIKGLRPLLWILCRSIPSNLRNQAAATFNLLQSEKWATRRLVPVRKSLTLTAFTTASFFICFNHSIHCLAGQSSSSLHRNPEPPIHLLLSMKSPTLNPLDESSAGFSLELIYLLVLYWSHDCFLRFI